MSEVIWAAVITAAATVICQLIISARSANLISYRVGELEKKVDKLSDLTRRMCLIEEESRRNAEMIDRLDGAIPHLPHFAQGGGHVV